MVFLYLRFNMLCCIKACISDIFVSMLHKWYFCTEKYQVLWWKHLKCRDNGGCGFGRRNIPSIKVKCIANQFRTIATGWGNILQNSVIGFQFFYFWLGDVACLDITYNSIVTVHAWFRDWLRKINYIFEYQLV